MEKLKENKTLLGVGIILLLLGVMGMSYAWFSATVNQENVKDQVVSTGTLELTYTDGTEIKLVNARPGATATKTITVKNTGTLDTSYNLVWQVLKNEITNDEMVMSATCERLNKAGDKEENCEGLDETPITGNMVLKGVDIPSGYSHEYTVTVTFKELSKDQNYNQGKSFMGVLGIDEYKEVTPKYCTFDGDMTQGAEYTDGTYTYRYMQQGGYYPENSNLLWENMTTEGWGVQLSDKSSTDAVTEAPCTYINETPIVSYNAAFSGSKSSNIDLSGTNTKNVKDMQMMFAETVAQNINLNNFDTSNVTNMNGMFSMSSVEKIIGLENFDTSNVTHMGLMFDTTSKLTSIDVSSFNTSNVFSMQGMFEMSGAAEIKGLENFNTSNVTDMSVMFLRTNVTSLDLSSFDTSKVANMNNMFSSMSNLTTIYVSDKFDVTNVRESSYMFYGNTKLKGGNGTTYNDSYRDKTYARIDTASTPGYFTAKQ